jgi:REP element-mobilizing transposase RayT
MNDDVGARASSPHRGWHDRGYLPHFDAGAIVQTVTFRLADSLPREYYEKAASIVSNAKERFFFLEKGIDQGRGDCVLTNPINASIVRTALGYFDGERYRLLAWAIMPIHLHAMIEPIQGYSLGGIVHSWKSYTANQINKGAKKRLWAPGYFDRYVRDEEHYANARFYIENNPVKARLVEKPEDWLYSSAAKRK